MNDLIALILLLSNDEAAAFLAFAKAKNQRTDVKNIKLFKLLRAGERKELDIKIYGKPSKNALHALTNRLKENLIDFTASKSLASDAEDELKVLKQLLAARIFLEQEQFSIGFKTLDKAIATATTLELYAILMECYHTYVQYAHASNTIVLEKLITDYSRNQRLYFEESKLVMAYATLKKELASKPTEVFQTVSNELDRFDITIDESLSFKSLFQIMTITTDSASLKSDYAGIASFMDQIYHVAERKTHLASRHVYYHCEILYLMAGTYFRNKRFAKSLELLETMESTLNDDHGTYDKVFQERLLLLRALNHNYTGAYNLAQETIATIKKPGMRVLLAQAMFSFQQEDFQHARRVLNGFHHSDIFYEKKEGLLWVIQKNILEILIYMELNMPDLVASKMRSFKKRYRPRLVAINEERVLVFMNLLRTYYDEPFKIAESSFKEKVEKAFAWKTNDQEDIFVMSFYAYLKAKMERTSIYTATLRLVQKP